MTTTREYTSETLGSSSRIFVRDRFESENLSIQSAETSTYIELKRYLLDVLGAVAWETGESTYAYRLKGEDTLTWGNIGSWIQLAWSRSAFKVTAMDSVLRKYSTYAEILGSSRIHQISQLYILRQPEETREFLLKHPHLIEVLLEGRSATSIIFGRDADVALEIVSDPELDNHQQLFAYIITSLPVEEAIVCLDLFDENWFLQQLDQVEELFNYNLELV